MIALLRCSVWVEIACCVKGPATTSTQVSLHQPSPKPPPSHRMFSRAAPLVPRCHCPSLLACAMRCDSVPVQLCAYTFSAQATNALAPSPGRPCNPTHAPSPEWSTPWSPPMLSLARTPKPCHHGVHPTAALSMRTHRMPTRAANPCGYGAGIITVSPFARSLTDIIQPRHPVQRHAGDNAPALTPWSPPP